VAVAAAVVVATSDPQILSASYSEGAPLVAVAVAAAAAAAAGRHRPFRPSL